MLTGQTMTRRNKTDFGVLVVCSLRWRGYGARAAFGLVCDVVQEIFGDWPLLYTVSLIIDAAAGIREAGGVGAYLRYTLKGICSFQCFGHDRDNGPQN